MRKDLSGIIVIAGVGLLAYLFMRQPAQGQTSGGGRTPTTPWYSILTGDSGKGQNDIADVPVTNITIYPANVVFPEMPAFSFFQDNGAGGGQGTPTPTPTPKKESQQAAAMAATTTYLTTPGSQQNAAMAALQRYLGVPVTGASGGASGGGGGVPSSKKESYSTTAGTPAGAALHAAAAHYGLTENKNVAGDYQGA